MRLRDILNIDEVKKITDELEQYTDYIPFELLSFIDRTEYFKRWTTEAKVKYRQTRQELPSDKNERNQYLLNDMLQWIENNPQYKQIINWEKIGK